MNYADWKNSKEKLGNFEGMFFAFNQEQLKEGIAKVGATKDNKITSIGAGGYILTSRLKEFEELVEGSNKRLKTLMKDFEFAVSAFRYELANHEYCITGDIEEAVYALNYTVDEVLNSKHLSDALLEARKQYIAEMEKEGY